MPVPVAAGACRLVDHRLEIAMWIGGSGRGLAHGDMPPRCGGVAFLRVLWGHDVVGVFTALSGGGTSLCPKVCIGRG